VLQVPIEGGERRHVGVCSDWAVLGKLIQSSLSDGDTPEGPTHRPLWPLGGSGAAAEERLGREWQPGAKRRDGAAHGWGRSTPVCSSRHGSGIVPTTSTGWSRGGARLDLGAKSPNGWAAQGSGAAARWAGSDARESSRVGLTGPAREEKEMVCEYHYPFFNELRSRINSEKIVAE
jgi:hypothetical protein